MVSSKESVIKALCDVPPENSFWVCDGSVLKNLDELLKALRKMKTDVYSYHVNNEKNDFSNWIKDVMGNVKLAGDVSKAKNKGEMIRVLSQRVKWLRKRAKN